MPCLWMWVCVCLHTTIWHACNLEHTTVKILGLLCVSCKEKMYFTWLHHVYLWLCYLYEVVSVSLSRVKFILVTLAYSSLEKTRYSLAAFAHES